MALAVSFWLSRNLLKVPGLDRMVLADGRAGSEGAGVAESADLAAKRAMLGAAAVALTDLRPVGKVRLDGPGRSGELEARTEGPALDRGARVRVIGVSSGRLVVEPLPAEASPPGDSPAADPPGEAHA